MSGNQIIVCSIGGRAIFGNRNPESEKHNPAKMADALLIFKERKKRYKKRPPKRKCRKLLKP
ncbi:hypothetical protein [Candidatus Hakubella thermalkaliphila]|uniref:hypothetical protein n=1 Tax=Candidatus Hakubella thermalkaliphila TaxID=2754717 RepID=UPI001593F425|nr:hypothetical protein [Candidatus Hakubella thermalkaliphila]